METVYVRRNRFSERLKAKRAEAGLGQIAFAQLLGIAQPTLAKYEMCKREPDLDGLMNICERLNTTPNEMLGFESPSAPGTAVTTGANSPIISGNGNSVTIGAPGSPGTARPTRKRK